jgi:hypothetical protein
MTNRLTTTGTVAAILAVLVGIQSVTRWGEYHFCVFRRLNAATSYAEDRERIEQTCARLHLWFLFPES